jgi:hypothetical protein
LTRDLRLFVRAGFDRVTGVAHPARGLLETTSIAAAGLLLTGTLVWAAPGAPSNPCGSGPSPSRSMEEWDECVRPSAHAAQEGAGSGLLLGSAALAKPASEPVAREAAPPATQSLPPSADGWRRWVDVPSAAAGLRYRARTFEGQPGVQNNLQSMVNLRARLKFDRGERVALHTLTTTGGRFRSGWNDTGLGTGSRSFQTSMKQLFAAVRPARAVRIEVGGLDIARGQSTEATTYDNDGYVVGQRVSVGGVDRGMGTLLVTRAHLGDLDTPNVLPRLRRLDRSNLHQVQVTRQFRPATISAEYTRHAESDVVRAATLLDVRATRVAHGLRFENYARLDPDQAYGFALTLRRQLSPALAVDLGLSRIDPDYGPLNGDRFATGQRAFGGLALEARPGLTLSTVLLQVVGGYPFTGPRTRLDVVLMYDAARAWR